MKVGTHDGIFHADDTFSIALLLRIHEDVTIVRTRDKALLESCDLRVDVGGVYDHEKLSYDHHQKGGAGERKNGIPYAGFGLLWKHYGLDACGMDPLVATKVEKTLVQPIDAADCGFKLHTGWVVEDVYGYSISSAISSMNPSWQEEPDFDKFFTKAVVMATHILSREITRAEAVFLAEEYVRESASRMEGRIIVLDKACPWKEVVIREFPEALFVVYESETGTWMVQVIPPELGSFEMKKALPEDWAGLRNGELQEMTGVEDAVFSHPGRFICGAKSKEGAMAMAKLAVAAE